MDSNDQRAPWGLPEAQPSTLLESKGCVPGGMRWLLPPSATRSALLGGDRGLWCGTSSSLQTESTVQHNGEKRITILQSPLTNHFPTFAVWESSLVLFPSAGLKPTNSSTVSGAKLHRQLQSLLIQGSSTSSNSAFIYKWFDQIPPPILTGFHNTRHTPHVDFSNVNSTIRIWFKIKKISSQLPHWFVIVTSMDQNTEGPGMICSCRRGPWLHPAQGRDGHWSGVVSLASRY